MKKGDTVFHEQFGIGTIKRISDQRRFAQIDFKHWGIREVTKESLTLKD